MAQLLSALLFCVAAGALGASISRGTGAKSQGFLAAGMQPEVAAKLLVGVEDEWLSMADSFIACRNRTEEAAEPCESTELGFFKSCGTVVTALVQGSSGDAANVREYMGDVCSKGPLSGWRQHQCLSLAAAVDGAMSVDAYDNRERLNTTDLCQKYWAKFTTEEKVIVAERIAEEEAKAAAEAAERKKAEEAEAAERKKAEEAEAAERKAQEEAEAAERKKQEEEEAKAREEAAKEAKVKAAEEAKAQAEAAQRKAEEAKAAAEEAARQVQAKRAEADRVTASVNATMLGKNATVADSPANVTDEADAALARANRALSSTA